MSEDFPTVTAPEPGLKFLLQWVLATTGSVVLIALSCFCPLVIYAGPADAGLALISPLGLVPLIGIAILGGPALGLAQWLVLRSQVAGAGWWVPATSGGWYAGIVLAVVPANNVFLIGFFFMVWFGGAVGIAQWLVLRRLVARAGWWVLATIGGSLGMLALIVLAVAGPFSGNLQAALSTVLSVSLYGAITGFVLVRLLRSPLSREEQPAVAE